MANTAAHTVARLDPVLDFLSLLWSVEHGLNLTSKRMATVMGVTGPQRLVLRIVGRHPGVSAGGLARIVQLHPSTITGILHRLERKQLIARERDQADARRVRLRLAGSARAFTKPTGGTIEHAVTRALRRFKPSELAHARRVLAATAEALIAGTRPRTKGRG